MKKCPIPGKRPSLFKSLFPECPTGYPTEKTIRRQFPQDRAVKHDGRKGVQCSGNQTGQANGQQSLFQGHNFELEIFAFQAPEIPRYNIAGINIRSNRFSTSGYFEGLILITNPPLARSLMDNSSDLDSVFSLMEIFLGSSPSENKTDL